MKVALKTCDECRVSSIKGRARTPDESRITFLSRRSQTEEEHVAHRRASLVNRPSSIQGIALVITLILLSVITLMAVAFLVMSTAQRNASVTAVDAHIARLAANNALERALADTVSAIVTSGNEFNYDLLVPTNYYNPSGFVTGLVSPTNVNYDYTSAGAALSANDALVNLENLKFNPRPPVFVVTNRALGSNEFRYYLDLNRNGRFEPTGWSFVTNNSVTGPVRATDTNGNPVISYLVGDPQWIGALEFPDRPHGPDNRFNFRWTYIVVPVGKTLDVNTVHNQANLVNRQPNSAVNPAYNPLGLDFRRNQGVGPWEINLASFLYDLNTNTYAWGGLYRYDLFGPTAPNLQGTAWFDAFSILTNRYGPPVPVNGPTLVTSYLSSFPALYPSGSNAALCDSIDSFGAGPFMVTNWHPLFDPDKSGNRFARPWPGANTTNRLFTHQDFFDPGKSSTNFVWHLTNYASTSQSTYDRYTYYRMLAQLGTDSSPENPAAVPKPVLSAAPYGAPTNLLVTIPNHGYFMGDRVTLISGTPPRNFGPYKIISVPNANAFVLQGAGVAKLAAPTVALDPFANAKIDLNYDNVNTNRESFTAWNPTDFFNAAADRLLRRQVGTITTFPSNGGAVDLAVASTNYLSYIPIYPASNNLYTASLHRLLQLAANIYDSTTNRTYGILGATNGFPTVFRPFFRRAPNGQIVIAGYREVTNAPDMLPVFRKTASHPFVQLDTGWLTNTIPVLGTPFGPDATEPMVSGFPLIIGAKKGFPSFNEFEMQTQITLTRKLQFLSDPKSATASNPAGVTQTNQMYLLAITNNMLGIEAWNSYTSTYPRNLQLITFADMSEAILTNSNTGTNQLQPVPVYFAPPIGLVGYTNNPQQYRSITTNWPGGRFVTPLNPNTPLSPNFSNSIFAFQTNASFSHLAGEFVVPYQTNFENLSGASFPAPYWFLMLKTRFFFVLVDTTVVPSRIVDYVNLESPDGPLDLAKAFMDGCNSFTNSYRMDAQLGSMFNTNRLGPLYDAKIPTYGILNQIYVGLGKNTNGLDPNMHLIKDALASYWSDYRGGQAYEQIDSFRTNLLSLPPLVVTHTNLAITNQFDAPFQPSRDLFIYTSWKANDPLVHYTIGDLADLNSQATNRYYADQAGRAGTTIQNIGTTNTCYAPWGNLNNANVQFNLAVQDPQVTRSDDWDFPTNKYPNPGWLGQVHRGTPWQTVYLKGAPIDWNTWQIWSRNGQMVPDIGQMTTIPNIVNLYSNVPDFAFTYPTNDWRLLDLFTTAMNDNAAAGRLSINQTNLAAWSGILGGVITLANDQTNTPHFAPVTVNPAGAYDPNNTANLPPLVRIVNAINDTRRTRNPSRQVFDHLGDILAVPELTIGGNPRWGITNGIGGWVGNPQYVGNWPTGYWAGVSPYLNLGNPVDVQNNRPRTELKSSLNDAAYERIPQQILGLLKCDHTPRLVVYAYGQALKSADHSVLTSGPFLGLCTNYQVTAEVATRAVVRIDGAPNNPHAVIESFNILPPD